MNKSVSDVIEDFINKSLDADQFIELSRNDLAKFFSCVPSQINYVLNTRFTINRGFVVESQRGGSGYIKVVRVQDNDENFLKNAFNMCENPMSFTEASQLLMQMRDRKLLTEKESALLRSAISAKALTNPINIDNKIRANIIGQVVTELMKNSQLRR